MVVGGQICRRTGTTFGRTQQDHKRNVTDNRTSGLVGRAITRVLSKGQLPNLKMAAVRPYLLVDQNRIRANIASN